MASSEHLVLSDFIKSVHQELREASQKLGVKEAWQIHCTNEENLKKYANAMKELATNHWEQNHEEQLDVMSRISWTCNMCRKYFSSEIFKCREKEEVTAVKLNSKISFADSNDISNTKKLKLLDVGSCYNPFSKFDYFDVTAIDIAPAVEEVLKCDFLDLKIDEPNKSPIIISQEVHKLPKNHFDIVVFCLFLEYLPCPKQRLICCEKVYSLLKTEGLLIIVTPDSNHVGSNAKYIKSWRFILAEIGFSRIKYEKLPHLHCMAFRKAACREITQRWAKIHEEEQVYSEIFIPQDFKVKPKLTVEESKSQNMCVKENYLELLDELPTCDIH